MDNLLEYIENDYSKFCDTEYIFYLHNKNIVNLRFEIENLPHLIGLHKLKEDYSEIRQMVDKNDVYITPANIFRILQEKNIDYNTIKKCLSWNTRLQNRMENFTYNKIDSILRKTTIFSFIYEEGKTKNKKAKYVLIDKPSHLFLQLYIGYDSKTKRYFPNSFVADYKKDSNLGRDTLKIIKTEVYKINCFGTYKIETIEHEKIRLISQNLKQNLKKYNTLNQEMYKLANEDKEYKELLIEINNLINDLKMGYCELIKYISINAFFSDKSNDKLKRFFKLVNMI